METFILSMQCQRYKNWELIFISDGQFDRGSKFKLWCHPLGVYNRTHFQYLDDGRIRAIETPEPLGLWGHPYRQLGIDAANGEFIGLQNDDNYLTPGFIEQLVGNIIHYNADICACETVHSYSGWGVSPAGTDLGCFIARASLMKKVKWPGNHFTADQDYFRALCKETEAAKVLALKKPLFIHN
jgi:GT2 family glycosyltransferase